MISFSHNYLFFWFIIYLFTFSNSISVPISSSCKTKTSTQKYKNTLFFFLSKSLLGFSYHLLSTLFCLLISDFMVKRGHAWTLRNNNCICGINNGIALLCLPPPPPLCPTNILLIKISSAVCFQNRCGERDCGTFDPLLATLNDLGFIPAKQGHWQVEWAPPTESDNSTWIFGETILGLG